MEVADLGDAHPNTYRLTLFGDDSEHTLIAISTGGGMIEVIEIDGHPVSLFGDYEVTLLWSSGDATALASELDATGGYDDVSTSGDLVIVSGQKPISPHGQRSRSW